MNGTAARTQTLSRWWPLGMTSRWLPLGIALAAALVVYAPAILGMAAEWQEFPSLSHGFAVPVLAIYLLWRQRDAIAAAPMDSSVGGLVLLVLALGALALGTLGGEPFIARLSFPLTLFGLVLFLAGPAVTRRAWIGLAYLTFMIPLPYLTLKALTYQSRLFDAGITATVLGWLGVPVLHNGVMLILPNITLEVADDCSSVPAIAALVALGAAYAQMQPRPGWLRATLTLAAAPLGLLSNIVRLILTSVAAYYFGPVALQSTIHKFSGTSVFLLTVALLVVLDSALSRVFRRAD
jgi:exosortase